MDAQETAAFDTTQTIAVEIGAMIRAHDMGIQVERDDMFSAVLRLINSDAITSVDALALLTIAKRLVTAAHNANPDDLGIHVIASLLEKAVSVLETVTDTPASTFEGAYQPH